MEEWSTANLSLVTYLVMQEHELLRTEWSESFGRSSCSWVFRESPELADDVSDFEGGNGQVDPKTFSYLFGRIKRSMMEART